LGPRNSLIIQTGTIASNGRQVETTKPVVGMCSSFQLFLTKEEADRGYCFTETNSRCLNAPKKEKKSKGRRVVVEREEQLKKAKEQRAKGRQWESKQELSMFQLFQCFFKDNIYSLFTLNQTKHKPSEPIAEGSSFRRANQTESKQKAQLFNASSDAMSGAPLLMPVTAYKAIRPWGSSYTIIPFPLDVVAAAV
jgi:hypothetical protein